MTDLPLDSAASRCRMAAGTSASRKRWPMVARRPDLDVCCEAFDVGVVLGADEGGEALSDER